MESALRVCANCRVLVRPVGAGEPDNPFLVWEHEPEFAEKFSRTVCGKPAPGREPSGSERRFGLARIKTPGGDKHVLRDVLAELARPEGEPLTVAVDGSYKLTVGKRVMKPMSWAYLTTDGRYGLGTSIVPGSVVGGRTQPNGSDPERTLQAELRAIANALAVIGRTTPVTIISDSQDAIGFMNLWRDGHQVYPGGYNTERAGGRESTLARLARRAAEYPDLIRLQWVPGHTGHPLNEAADGLARAARAWATDRLTQDATAELARQIVQAALEQHGHLVG